MEFSRQEYWSGLPFPSPGDLPNPGFEPRSPTLKADTLPPVQLFGTPWTAAHQAPLSMGFSRQEYWSELPCPPPGDLSHPGIKPFSPALQTNYLPSEPPVKVKDDQSCLTFCDRTATVHGILQDRILEWVAFPFSRGSS